VVLILLFLLINVHGRYQETGKTQICTVITGVDYCNSVLAGLPACTLAPLQRVKAKAKQSKDV